jgi:NitT/TauT family transport system ATP-binding protein
MTTSSGSLLSCTGLRKEYATDAAQPFVAVDSVDLALRPGEFVSLVGPSGCGKTTLLKMLAGVIPATRGSIDYMGTGRAVGPRDVGLVFQQAALLPWRTVLSNITLPADILKLDRKAARERATELLEMLALDPGTAKRYPIQLSGGMQQRVSIARALLHDPQVLMMDEPFGALDAMTRESLHLHLQEIATSQEKTVLFVTHSISEAVFLSDRVAVMHTKPGRIAGVLDIDLPRPRRLLDMSGPRFGAFEREIRALLDANDQPHRAASAATGTASQTRS